MHWKLSNFLLVIIRSSLFCLLTSLFFTSCAQKPWTDPLGDDEIKPINQVISTLIDREAACSPTLESDLSLFYQNPFDRKGLSGFFQFSQPASYKFVMSNPLGQPLLVIAGDKDNFQAINTQKRSYLAGSLRSFALRNDIPHYFIAIDWSALITARHQLGEQTISDIRYDREGRGIWLTFQKEPNMGLSHLLVNLEQEVVVEYILEKGNGSTAAKISYADWRALGECKQPRDITIEGLDYGIEVELKLSNIQMLEEQKSFRLPPPSGYNRHYMP